MPAICTELGVRQHDHVVLVLPTCPLALQVMFAANYLGAVYVPVNPALKGSALEHVLHNAGARIAIVHDSVLEPRACGGAGDAENGDPLVGCRCRAPSKASLITAFRR